MQKIFAFTQGLPLRQRAQSALALSPMDARRHAAHALACGQRLALDPQSSESALAIASLQRKALLFDALSRLAGWGWQLAALPALALGARWGISRLSEPSGAEALPETALSFLLAAGFTALCLALSHELGALATRQLGLDEGSLDLTPEQINELIDLARPALALLDQRGDPMALPSFGLICADTEHESSGEALSGARLSHAQRVEVYSEREWAPARSGLRDGDAVCHFFNGERSASMAMGPQGLARLGIDLSFAIERARELGLPPDPQEQELDRRARERLSKNFLSSLL